MAAVARGRNEGRTDADGRIIVLHVYCASVAAAAVVVIDRSKASVSGDRLG